MPQTRSTSSISDGVLVHWQSDSGSISSINTESQGLVDHVASIRLNEDIPLPSIEGDSTNSSGGVNLLGGIRHSRTPSLSLSPPPGRANRSRTTSEDVDFRRENGSSDSRLGMSQVAAAIDGITTGADGPGLLLHPERSAATNTSASRRSSRRRSSPRVSLPPHNVIDEALPRDHFHDPTFQAAFSNSKRLMSELTSVLSSSSLRNEPDTTMRRLYVEGQKLAQFQCPSTRILGFVGDSGAGKSSLLNSLLDVEHLARTSNSGEACTCVATEYHHQNSNGFAIEVEYFSLQDITTQLAELLQCYRQYHLHQTNTVTQEPTDLKNRAKLARDTFRAMFRGRLENEQFLTSWPETTVMRTLELWAAEFIPPSTSSREELHSKEDCSLRLMQLTSEENSTQGPARWPYISKIKVFLESHILSKGLVLVDLPGLRDLNSARRMITERYLLNCDEIFAICSIGRVSTDESVQSIFRLAGEARLSNIGIICTKSDEVDVEEAKKDWRNEEEKLERIQRLQDAIAREQMAIVRIESELNEFDSDDEMSEGELREHLRLRQRSKQAARNKEQHQFKLKEYLVEIRNASIKQKLNGLYHNTDPRNPLQTFCISNTDYWENRNLPSDLALPRLELSGILAVRKHCISLVSERQYRIASQYILNDIPALMGDVELWVQSGAGSVNSEQREAIRETLRTVELRLNRDLTGTSSQINRIARIFKEAFNAHIFSARQVTAWTQAASNKSSEWSGWHHASYSAFCQNYGDHYTETKGHHNWNESAIAQMARDLNTPWGTLHASLFETLGETQSHMTETLDQAIRYLETELEESSESTNTLCRTMISRQNLLLADVEQIFETFDSDLRRLRTEGLSGIRTSLIGQLMEGSYNACNAELGLGSDGRRKKIINSKLGDEATFETLQTRFRNTFRQQADSLQQKLQSSIETHLAVIKNTLDILRSENIALESEREPEFRARVETEVRRARDEIQRIRQSIQS